MTLHFSWPQFKRPWELAFENVELVGVEAEVEVYADQRRVRLDVARDWESFRLHMRMASTETKPAELTDLDAYVLVASARTNTRLPVRLTADGPGAFVGGVELPRDLVAGSVQIEGQVVSPGDPVRLVGTSEPWTLVVDASEAPPLPGAPAIDTAWLKFSSDDAPPVARAAQDSYAVMDMTGVKPTLLLNEEINGFRALLSASKAQLERRRLRDTLGTSIARYALGALFREAKARITIEDGDEVSPPEDHLLQQVCEAVAGEVKSVSGVDDLYRQLATEATLTSLDRGRLWVEIDNAIDRLTHHSETVASIVEEVRHA